MAKRLARIHGTEEDKVNCPFYFKIGACRHSDRCSRLHHKPAFSQTLLFQHLYKHPTNAVSDEEKLEDFLCFYEDMYLELSKFGRLEGLYVADNLGDHMVGHVYAKFQDEEDATDCLQVMHGRYYNGTLILVEYSPVTDFREARCRDFDEDNCQRGGYCNFLHVKPVPNALIASLEEDAQADRQAEEQKKHRSFSSRSGSSRKRRREERVSSDRDGASRDNSYDEPHRRSNSSGGYHQQHHRDHESRRSRRD